MGTANLAQVCATSFWGIGIRSLDRRSSHSELHVCCLTEQMQWAENELKGTCMAMAGGSGEILSTMPTIDWVLLGFWRAQQGSPHMQLVCRYTLPLGRKGVQ
jgi:hypothetical protein